MKNNFGLPLIFFFFIAGLIFNLQYLVFFTIVILLIYVISSWWCSVSLNNVTYRREFSYTRGFPDEKSQFKIFIQNQKLIPLSWLHIQDPWPYKVAPEDESILAPSNSSKFGYLTHLFSLRWYESVQKKFNIIFRKRGIYTVGPASLVSGDLLGIFENHKSSETSECLTIFPALCDLSEVYLTPNNPFGQVRSNYRLFEDPNQPIGVREYHYEDSVRRIHWPATARTGKLQVKVFQHISSNVLVICLNVSTMEHYWEGIQPELFEYLISISATLIKDGIDAGYQVGMISNGCMTNSDQVFRIQPGRAPNHLAKLLQSLAGITPMTNTSFERLLMREVSRVPYGATLIILTATVSLDIQETLLHLKRHERRIILLSLSEDEPPYIPGIVCIHQPFSWLVEN